MMKRMKLVWNLRLRGIPGYSSANYDRNEIFPLSPIFSNLKGFSRNKRSKAERELSKVIASTIYKTTNENKLKDKLHPKEQSAFGRIAETLQKTRGNTHIQKHFNRAKLAFGRIAET